jgi:YD repeat-containing protein
LSILLPTNGATSYSYDALGRKVSQTDSDGVSAQYWSYNGPTVTFQDEDGNQWQRTTDALGRLITVLEPNGSNKTPSMETDYTYDDLNNLLSVTQWGGLSGSSGARTRSFTYNSLSRLLKAVNPETGTVGYTYDANGNVQTKTDARGVTTIYSYDALNRLLSKSYSSDPYGTPFSCYQYDSSAAANGIGRLWSVWTQSASAGLCPAAAPTSGILTKRSILAYDPMGRIWSEQQYTPATLASGTPYAPQYTYDLTGNLLTSTDGTTPSPTVPGTALTFTNSFDCAGHLQTLTSNWVDATHPQSLFSTQAGSSTPCMTPSYAPFGGLMNAMFGNGLMLNRAYDSRLRVTSEIDTGSAVTSATSGSATVTITGSEQTK